jgi:hypothetical protein
MSSKNEPPEWIARFKEQVSFGDDEGITHFPVRGASLICLQSVIPDQMGPQPLKDAVFRQSRFDLYQQNGQNDISIQCANHIVTRSGFEFEDEFNPIRDNCMPYESIALEWLPDVCEAWGGNLRPNLNTVFQAGRASVLNKDLVVLITNLSIKTFMTPFRSMSIQLRSRVRRAVMRFHGPDYADRYDYEIAFLGSTYMELHRYHGEFFNSLTVDMLCA